MSKRKLAKRQRKGRSKKNRRRRARNPRRKGSSGKCSQCGRSGHYASTCGAKRAVRKKLASKKVKKIKKVSNLEDNAQLNTEWAELAAVANAPPGEVEVDEAVSPLEIGDLNLQIQGAELPEWDAEESAPKFKSYKKFKKHATAIASTNVAKFAKLFGIDPKHPVFYHRGTPFTIVDIKPNRPKYPITAENHRGTRYRFSVAQATQGVGPSVPKKLTTAPKCLDCRETCILKVSRWNNSFWACPNWADGCPGRVPQEAGALGIAKAATRRPRRRWRRRRRFGDEHLETYD